MEFIDILRMAVQQGASDVHILVGKPPLVRITGEITELAGFPVVTAEESKRLIYSILYEEQKQRCRSLGHPCVSLPAKRRL